MGLRNPVPHACRRTQHSPDPPCPSQASRTPRDTHWHLHSAFPLRVWAAFLSVLPEAPTTPGIVGPSDLKQATVSLAPALTPGLPEQPLDKEGWLPGAAVTRAIGVPPQYSPLSPTSAPEARDSLRKSKQPGLFNSNFRARPCLSGYSP